MTEIQLCTSTVSWGVVVKIDNITFSYLAITAQDFEKAAKENATFGILSVEK